MVNESDKTEQKAKAVALLALALKNKIDNTDHSGSEEGIFEAKVNCPDEQMIASYCDGQLSAEERINFRTTMINCPESYALWMAMERYRSEWQKIDQPASNKTGLKQRLYQWLISPSHMTGSAVALASVLLVTIMLRNSSTPELSDSYEYVWTQPGFSFKAIESSSGQIKGIPVFVNPALKAFREGTDVSQQSIKNKSIELPLNACLHTLEVCVTPEALYQYAGSWSVLMKASCQLESESLYETQQILLNRWYEQWQTIRQLPRVKSGLDDRLEQLYQLTHNPGVNKKEFCQVNDELLRFALIQ